MQDQKNKFEKKLNEDVVMRDFVCPICLWTFSSGDPASVYCTSDCEVESECRAGLKPPKVEYRNGGYFYVNDKPTSWSDYNKLAKEWKAKGVELEVLPHPQNKFDHEW